MTTTPSGVFSSTFLPIYHQIQFSDSPLEVVDHANYCLSVLNIVTKLFDMRRFECLSHDSAPMLKSSESISDLPNLMSTRTPIRSKSGSIKADYTQHAEIIICEEEPFVWAQPTFLLSFKQMQEHLQGKKYHLRHTSNLPNCHSR